MSTISTTAPAYPDWCQTGPHCWTRHGDGAEALLRHDFDGVMLEQFVDVSGGDTVTESTIRMDVPTPWSTTMTAQLNGDVPHCSPGHSRARSRAQTKGRACDRASACRGHHHGPRVLCSPVQTLSAQSVGGPRRTGEHP